MTLYLEVSGCKGTDELTGFHHWIEDDEPNACIECGAQRVWAVPVEPCHHGNIFGHIKPTSEWKGVLGPTGADWCPSAGLREDTP